MYHMGNRYYTNHQKIHDLHYRSTFLPMLCSRPSIKDVVIPKSNSSFASHVSLTSPKIGCMGQVKRHNNKYNNKVCNSSTTHHHHRRQLSTDTTNTSHNINNKYSKLKWLFSSKSFTTRSIDSTSRSTNKQESNNKIIINIVDMDPPLPVIKKVISKPSDDDHVDINNNLYKRRSGGVVLKNLQLQRSQINSCRLQVNTV